MEGLNLFDTKVRQWSSRWGCSEPMQKFSMVEIREHILSQKRVALHKCDIAEPVLYGCEE